MKNYRCTNCQTTILSRHGLCRDCTEAAIELDRQVQRKDDEETLRELEQKPRNWRDVFYSKRAK